MLFGLTLLVLAFGLLWIRGQGEDGITPSPEEQFRERSVELMPVEVTRPSRYLILNESEEVSLDTKGTMDSIEDPTAEYLEVSGWVLEFTGEGAQNVSVHIRARHGTEYSGRATTGADGGFSLQLDTREWKTQDLASVHVSSEVGQRLFTGVVAIGEGITILLPKPLLLSGKILDLSALEIAQVSMRFDIPAGRRFASNLFVGKRAVDKDGSFSLFVRPPAVSETILLSFFQGAKPLARVLVSVSDLSSPEGVNLDLGLAPILIEFLDHAGSPIEGVQLGAISFEGATATPRLTEVSGQGGGVGLVLPHGRVELCAQKKGFHTKVWVLDRDEGSGPHTERVVLNPLGSPSLLEGTVSLADGSPLAGAYISAFPRSQTRVGFGARSTAHTDENGRFSVSISGDQPLKVIATHREHGRAPEVVLPSGEFNVDIRYAEFGGLLLDIESFPQETVARSGPIQCLLVDRKYDNVIRTHIWGSPSPMRDIPEGDYNLFVFWPGMDVFGASPVCIETGKTENVRLSLGPARWLHGSVLDPEGNPVPWASIELSSDHGATERPHPWSRTTSSPDGSFRLLVTEGSGSLDVRVRSTNNHEAHWEGLNGPVRFVVPE